MRYFFFLLAISTYTLSGCKTSDEELEKPQMIDANPFLIEPGSPALVVAHRGGRGLYPENTLLAFDNAVAMGVDVLEMDVCLTKDNILVTSHDLTVDRTSDTSGNIMDYTYAELQQFNFGYNFKDLNGTYPYRNDPVRIAKLEDIFINHPDALMMIEIKDPPPAGMVAAEKLNALIHTYNMSSKVSVFCFVDSTMNYFRDISGGKILTGGAVMESLNFYNAVQAGTDSAFTIRADIFDSPDSPTFTTEAFVSAAHRHNIAIHYWTINDKEEMKNLIQKGADGIITDRPDIMEDALSELGF